MRAVDTPSPTICKTRGSQIDHPSITISPGGMRVFRAAFYALFPTIRAVECDSFPLPPPPCLGLSPLGTEDKHPDRHGWVLGHTRLAPTPDRTAAPQTCVRIRVCM